RRQGDGDEHASCRHDMHARTLGYPYQPLAQYFVDDPGDGPQEGETALEYLVGNSPIEDPAWQPEIRSPNEQLDCNEKNNRATERRHARNAADWREHEQARH